MTVGKLEETAAAAQSSGTRRTAWSMTAVIILLYMINYADKAVYGIIAQPLARELGLTSSQIGMVGSLFFLMFTIGGFASGLLSRWFGLRWALLVLALVWSATVLPVVLSATLAVLIASRMLLGFAEGPSCGPHAHRGVLLACTGQARLPQCASSQLRLDRQDRLRATADLHHRLLRLAGRPDHDGDHGRPVVSSCG